jgi:sRNA-binding protein
MSNRATKVETAIAELVVAFPAAFTLDPTLVRPVKLGIRNDIYAQSAISRRHGRLTSRTCCVARRSLSILATRTSAER